MSIALMTVAWQLDMPSGRKLVLLSLCDNANDAGECYPSIGSIARRCGMSDRAAQGHIAELQKMGILSRTERFGRSTVYRIDPRRICTPAESAPPQNLHPTPAESAPPPAESAPYPAESAPPSPAESAPRRILEPSLNHQGNKDTARARSEFSKSVFKVDDVSDSVWRDFELLRKAKKSPITKTALDGIRSEAAKAGLTLEAALRTCCNRGWTGFKADWVTPDPGRTAGRGQGDPAWRVEQRARMRQAAPGVAAKTPADAPIIIELEADHGHAITLG